jgi:dUTP pyrophosphatase
MKIRIVNKSRHKLPEYTTGYSAGMDLRANIDNDIVREPMKRVLVKTGLFLEIPVLNSPGTIDADYRGEGGFGHTGKQ